VIIFIDNNQHAKAFGLLSQNGSIEGVIFNDIRKTTSSDPGSLPPRFKAVPGPFRQPPNCRSARKVTAHTSFNENDRAFIEKRAMIFWQR
jgi:hypothetical protein